MADAAYVDRFEAATEIIKAFNALALDELVTVTMASIGFLSWQVATLGVEQGFGVGLSAASGILGEDDST